MEKTNKSNKKTILILLVVALLMTFIPLFAMKGAEFGGSDDAGSQVVSEVDSGYQSWFDPILETAIGGELPGEIESLLFCIQTGIGVGICAFFIGRFYERKKLGKENKDL